MSNPRSAYMNSVYTRQLRAHYDKQDAGVLAAEEILNSDEAIMAAKVKNIIDSKGTEALLAACAYLSDISDATERLASTFEARGQIEQSESASQDAAALSQFVKEVEAGIHTYQEQVSNDNSPAPSVRPSQEGNTMFGRIPSQNIIGKALTMLEAKDRELDQLRKSYSELEAKYAALQKEHDRVWGILKSERDSHFESLQWAAQRERTIRKFG